MFPVSIIDRRLPLVLVRDRIGALFASRDLIVRVGAGAAFALAVAACGDVEADADVAGATDGGSIADLPNGHATHLPGPYRLSDVALFGDTLLVRHDDDLWVVSRAGGTAARLLPTAATDQDGEAVPFPRYAPAFAPEGGRIAFSAGGDVYLLDRAGGAIRRITWHPRGDEVRTWTPAGDSILFSSFRRTSGNNFQLHVIPAKGGIPVELPLRFAYDGALSPDGGRLVVHLFGSDGLFGWIGYRGGSARALYVLDRATGTVVDSVPHEARQDVLPMWWGDDVYFVSARNAAPADAGRRAARANAGQAAAGRASASSSTGRLLPGGFDLYRWHPGERRVERLTAFRYGGIDGASAGPDAIILAAEGRLYLYEPGEGRLTGVPLRFPEEELVPADSARVPVAEWARTPAPGAGSAVMASEVRGDVVVWDRRTDHVRFLTRTPESREHGPALSPDGTLLAYWSDASGEDRLQVARLPDVGGEPADVRELVVEKDPSSYRELIWSPDGHRLAFRGEHLGLWVTNPESGETHRIDSSRFPGQGSWEQVFSPDGRLLAYSKAGPRGVSGVFLHDVRSGRHVRVSDPLAHASHPAFDPSGRWLYFATGEQEPLALARHIPAWGLLSTNWAWPLLSARLQVAVLNPCDVPPVLPTGAPPLETETPESRTEDAEGRPASDMLDGIGGRVLPLPLDRRDVMELDALGPGAFLVRAAAWPETPAEAAFLPTPVYLWRRSSPAELERIVEDADEVVVAPGGEGFLYRRGDTWRLARPGPPLSEEELDWGDASLTVRRLPEWRQMYREVWRRVRTTYVGPERDALDLGALEEHYAAYLPHLRDRGDLNDLFAEMLGHLDLVSHLRVSGGAEWPRPGPREEASGPAPVGLLGADLVPEEERYRFARIYRNNRWSALFGEVTAPLDRPGLDVREGEYLLEVNGRPATTERSPFAYFSGTAGVATRLTVGPDPDGSGARTITVYPVRDDRMLRETTWAAANRRRVEEATGGRVGYVWLKSFNGSVLRNAIGAVAALQDRDALIVDVRFNGGGATADAFIEILGREAIYAYDYRHGDDLRIPPITAPPSRVLIASQHDASAAETFVLMWKEAGLGPVVGTPTMGALVGASLDQPPLADGGSIGVPNRASHAPGLPVRELEGVGVEPDRNVDWKPADWQAGRDPQLEAAIEEAIRLLDASRLSSASWRSE